jgi:chemotaxis protein methyltransferase CheR
MTAVNDRPVLSAADFNYIRDLAREHSALSLDAGKEYLVQSRLEPLARQEGFHSLHDLIARLRFSPFGDLHLKIVEALTTNETSFFRDAVAFAMIGRSILPALLTERSAERSLNIWCAACSSGQEPYSVAMLLREHRPSLDGWKINIIASDMSREMLGRARAGRYSRLEINRGLPAGLLVKYVVQHGSVWEIRREIRQMVEFRDINLIRSWPHLPGMHLVLMRNVLIYFEPGTRKQILERTARLLDPAGYLVLGGSETTVNMNESFEPVTMQGTVCFRRRRVRPLTR